MRKNLAICIVLTLFLTTGCAANRAYDTVSDGAFAPVEALAGDTESEGTELAYGYAQSRADGVLSSFTTEYNQKNKNRAENIRLATQSIDGAIVCPGETFSFNDTVGPTNRANGYKLAAVFFNREETKGYGGGVCQVSSTLFNAAEIAGLEIVERHTHSLDVSYVEKGRDAATSRKGKLDLKFTNVHSYPVVIRAHSSEGILTVEVHTL